MSLVKIFAVLSLLVTVSTLSNTMDTRFILNKFIDQPKDLFKAYYSLFEKHQEYDINTEEGLKRYQIFKNNVENIKKMNEKAGVEAYGITQFTDMTHEEYKATLMPSHELEKLMGASFDDTPIKIQSQGLFSNVKEVDWRPFLTEIKNQGSCGSCWAFGAMAAVEGKFNIDFGVLNDLSEQYLVDCDDKDNGCNGGWPTRTFSWLTEHGVRLEKDKPYTAKKGICSASEKESSMNIVTGSEFCSGNCTAERWYELLAQGPIVIAVDAGTPEWSCYRPVSDEIPLIPTGCSRINHAVNAVGVKMISGEPHLIIRNSWGQSWGAKGYALIPASNHCFAMNYGWLPTVHQEEPFPKPTCPEFYNSCDATRKKFNTCEGIQNSEEIFGSGGKLEGFKTTEDIKFWNFFKEPRCKGKANWMFQSYECFTKKFFWRKPEDVVYVSAAPEAESPGSSCVFLYGDTCFSGQKTKLCTGVEDLDANPIGSVKSIQFNKRSKYTGNIRSVIFFEKKGYEGKAYSFANSDSGDFFNLEDDLDFQNAVEIAKSVNIIYEEK